MPSDYADGATKTSTSCGVLGSASDPTGWELALVSTDTNNTNSLTESKLAGGFDRLLLDSLYVDAETRKQQLPQCGVSLEPNPHDPRNPFVMSHRITAPTNVQMALMVQQQQQMMMS